MCMYVYTRQNLVITVPAYVETHRCTSARIDFTIPKCLRYKSFGTRWRHQMETFCALLALCAGNSLVTGEFLLQRPVTRSFDVFFDLRLNRRLTKQSWRRWLGTSSRSLWHHYNDTISLINRQAGGQDLMKSWNLVSHECLCDASLTRPRPVLRLVFHCSFRCNDSWNDYYHRM